jgi:DNA-binding response OmpR family regulator
MLAPMGGGERILVVEDEKDICESVCATLREDGYVVVSAATVAEARARIDAESFDAVVLDLWLPDGNGDLVRDFRGLGEGYGYGVAWTP